MRALILLIIFAIGAVGIGYLGNDFVAAVQQYGVGAGDIQNPVMDTKLQLQILRVPGPLGFNDLITQCNFTSLGVDLQTGTKLFCKLYDGPNIKLATVIAEGTVQLSSFVPAGTPIPIPITTFVFPQSNDMNGVRNAVVLVQNQPA